MEALGRFKFLFNDHLENVSSQVLTLFGTHYICEFFLGKYV